MQCLCSRWCLTWDHYPQVSQPPLLQGSFSCLQEVTWSYTGPRVELRLSTDRSGYGQHMLVLFIVSGVNPRGDIRATSNQGHFHTYLRREEGKAGLCTGRTARSAVVTSRQCVKRHAASIGTGRWRNVNRGVMEGMVQDVPPLLLLIPCGSHCSWFSCERTSIFGWKGKCLFYQEWFKIHRGPHSLCSVGSYYLPVMGSLPFLRLTDYEKPCRQFVS